MKWGMAIPLPLRPSLPTTYSRTGDNCGSFGRDLVRQICLPDVSVLISFRGGAGEGEENEKQNMPLFGREYILNKCFIYLYIGI